MSTSDASPAAILFDKNLSAISSFNDGTYNRLCVDTRPTLGVQAQQAAFGVANVANTIALPMLSSGAAALNVNGGTTAQVFSVAAQSKLVTIYAVRIVFVFTAVAFNGTNFGNAAITKGIAIGATISGAAQGPAATLKTNEDFFLLNGSATLTSPGTGILLNGSCLFNQPLAAGSSDTVTVTVQDNLSGTNNVYGRAYAYGIRAT